MTVWRPARLLFIRWIGRQTTDLAHARKQQIQIGRPFAGGREQDRLPVRRPLSVDALRTAHRRHLPQVGAVHAGDPELFRTGAGRGEDDLLTVRKIRGRRLIERGIGKAGSLSHPLLRCATSSFQKFASLSLRRVHHASCSPNADLEWQVLRRAEAPAGLQASNSATRKSVRAEWAPGVPLADTRGSGRPAPTQGLRSSPGAGRLRPPRAHRRVPCLASKGKYQVLPCGLPCPG